MEAIDFLQIGWGLHSLAQRQLGRIAFGQSLFRFRREEKINELLAIICVGSSANQRRGIGHDQGSHSLGIRKDDLDGLLVSYGLVSIVGIGEAESAVSRDHSSPDFTVR